MKQPQSDLSMPKRLDLHDLYCTLSSKEGFVCLFYRKAFCKKKKTQTAPWQKTIPTVKRKPVFTEHNYYFTSDFVVFCIVRKLKVTFDNILILEMGMFHIRDYLRGLELFERTCTEQLKNKAERAPKTQCYHLKAEQVPSCFSVNSNKLFYSINNSRWNFRKENNTRVRWYFTGVGISNFSLLKIKFWDFPMKTASSPHAQCPVVP